MAAALRFAADHGAVTVCNHPKPFGPPWEYADVEGYHCIEVWNGPWSAQNPLALGFWTERLAQGKRIVATGGSDWHSASQLAQTPSRAPGIPTLWVYVPGTPSAAGILQAIRAGHVALSDAPDGPLVDLRAGPAWAARGGDVLERAGNEELAVQVRCLRGAGHVLTLLDQRQILYEQELMEADAVVELSLRVADSLFVRAELYQDGNMAALTNPIYLQTAA
jgi:hypothetical protein